MFNCKLRTYYIPIAVDKRWFAYISTEKQVSIDHFKRCNIHSVCVTLCIRHACGFEIYHDIFYGLYLNEISITVIKL